MISNEVKLIDIVPVRDSNNAVNWINSPHGPQTLQLMGLQVPDDFTTTIEEELLRLNNIINNQEEIGWAIAYKSKIIGFVEIHLAPYESLSEPNISIMIGDYNFRGMGIGTIAMLIAIDYLKDKGYKEVYARVLTRNIASFNMLSKLEFKTNGLPYTTEDGQTWQNLSRLV